jgi:prepilin-type N-terminal cleavage/methylation domain-containing protein
MTLIEILIVIALISVLATVMVKSLGVLWKTGRRRRQKFL